MWSGYSWPSMTARQRHFLSLQLIVCSMCYSMLCMKPGYYPHSCSVFTPYIHACVILYDWWLGCQVFLCCVYTRPVSVAVKHTQYDYCAYCVRGPLIIGTTWLITMGWRGGCKSTPGNRNFNLRGSQQRWGRLVGFISAFTPPKKSFWKYLCFLFVPLQLSSKKNFVGRKNTRGYLPPHSLHPWIYVYGASYALDSWEICWYEFNL